jgi:hypothetical protein
LKAALEDLTVGKGSDLLKPAKKNGRPPDGSQKGLIQATAARALSEFIAAGDDMNQAAGRIARALCAGHRDMGEVKAQTVVNWRERLMRGPGRGASKLAVQRFLAPLKGFPDMPKERGEILLKALATPGGVIG